MEDGNSLRKQWSSLVRSRDFLAQDPPSNSKPIRLFLNKLLHYDIINIIRRGLETLIYHQFKGRIDSFTVNRTKPLSLGQFLEQEWNSIFSEGKSDSP